MQKESTSNTKAGRMQTWCDTRTYLQRWDREGKGWNGTKMQLQMHETGEQMHMTGDREWAYEACYYGAWDYIMNSSFFDLILGCDWFALHGVQALQLRTK